MVEVRSFPSRWGEGPREAIDAILIEQAAEAGHPFEVEDEELVFLAEEAGEMIGGLAATISQRWLHVDLLAVRPEARGHGIGRRLLGEAEAFAAGRGLVGVLLDTYGFQAPAFYARMGYVEFGRLEDQPPGQTRVFLRKRLDGGG